MKVTWGLDAGALSKKQQLEVCQDTLQAVNGHTLLVGMSGAGKTFQLKKMVRQMSASAEQAGEPIPKFYVFDVHGDIDIPASTVLFSEQTKWGLNPLRVNPDPHFGGIRKRVQGFVSTVNRVMRALVLFHLVSASVNAR